MSDLPPSFAQQLLAARIPLTLLLDLHDPDRMRVDLAAELLGSDVAQAPAPTASSTRPARSA